MVVLVLKGIFLLFSFTIVLYNTLVSSSSGVVIKRTIDKIFHPVRVKGLTHRFVLRFLSLSPIVFAEACF